MSTQALSFQQYYPKSSEDCVALIHEKKAALGDKVFILGHHYQREEVFQFADANGDSLKLAYLAAQTDAPYIVFCGVHFMAEVADMVTSRTQRVILPDMAAGCSMADMANLVNVEKCWQELSAVIEPDVSVTPITYVNSSADLKAFCGRHGGNICTSSNADKVLSWAFEQREKVLFFPDQHLGRNTAHKMGIPLSDMALWDFRRPNGGLTAEEIRRAKILLWDGWCSVHQRFSVDHITEYKALHGADVLIVAHPEAPFEVCQAADYVGATSGIIAYVEKAPEGAHCLVATELNLVNRLDAQHPDKKIQFMAPTVSMCSTMFRTDPQHLLWVLDNLCHDNVVNQVSVPTDVARDAMVALDRMFTVTA